MGLPNPYRETRFSGANTDREVFIFPVQLTTSRIGNLARLIHIVAICVMTKHTYIQTHQEWQRMFQVLWVGYTHKYIQYTHKIFRAVHYSTVQYRTVRSY